MAALISIPKWTYGFDHLDGRVSVERAGTSIFDEVRYLVRLDGLAVGHVERSTRTWEHRSAGKRYVNSRGETPCWRISRIPGEAGTRQTFTTRNAAAFTLAAVASGGA